jgi:glycerol-3-phosphate acyltransferase PlsX
LIKVALDAMGGDHAPDAVIEGARLAVEKGYLQAEQIVLVGRESDLEKKIAGLDVQGLNLVDAPDRLEMGGSPLEAMKKSPRNSITVGLDLVKQGDADAFVSAGNTGLVVASATLGLRCLEGIRRPGIGLTLTSESGPCVIVDVGANPHAKARHLLSYAIMGSAYFHDLFKKDLPRVGMLNIGSEDQKGNSLVREAGDLLKTADLNFEFVGNVEGVDIFGGACDVVVCDGFTGNVLLKSCEGVAEYLLRSMVRLLKENEAPADLMKRVIGPLQQEVDFSEYGGALLLGVEGIVTICHGRSEGPAICNAARFAAKAVGAKVNEHITNAAKAASPAS